jgi:hypothetical protein
MESLISAKGDLRIKEIEMFLWSYPQCVDVGIAYGYLGVKWWL